MASYESFGQVCFFGASSCSHETYGGVATEKQTAYDAPTQSQNLG
jgi:hypothetical protein